MSIRKFISSPPWIEDTRRIFTFKTFPMHSEWSVLVRYTFHVSTHACSHTHINTHAHMQTVSSGEWDLLNESQVTPSPASTWLISSATAEQSCSPVCDSDRDECSAPFNAYAEVPRACSWHSWVTSIIPSELTHFLQRSSGTISSNLYKNLHIATKFTFLFAIKYN